MLKPVMNTAVPPVSLTAELLYVQYPKDVYVRGVLNFEVGILHTGRTSNNKGNSNFLRTFSAFYFIFSAVMKVGYTIVLKMKQKVEKHCFTKVSYNSGEGSVNFALFAMLSGLESLSYMNWKDTDCLLLGQLLEGYNFFPLVIQGLENFSTDLVAVSVNETMLETTSRTGLRLHKDD